MTCEHLPIGTRVVCRFSRLDEGTVTDVRMDLCADGLYKYEFYVKWDEKDRINRWYVDNDFLVPSCSKDYIRFLQKIQDRLK